MLAAAPTKPHVVWRTTDASEQYMHYASHGNVLKARQYAAQHQFLNEPRRLRWGAGARAGVRACVRMHAGMQPAAAALQHRKHLRTPCTPHVPPPCCSVPPRCAPSNRCMPAQHATRRPPAGAPPTRCAPPPPTTPAGPSPAATGSSLKPRQSCGGRASGCSTRTACPRPSTMQFTTVTTGSTCKTCSCRGRSADPCQKK